VKRQCFIERAQNTLPDFTVQSQRASDKALTFIRSWRIAMCVCVKPNPRY